MGSWTFPLLDNPGSFYSDEKIINRSPLQSVGETIIGKKHHLDFLLKTVHFNRVHTVTSKNNESIKLDARVFQWAVVCEMYVMHCFRWKYFVTIALYAGEKNL